MLLWVTVWFLLELYLNKLYKTLEQFFTKDSLQAIEIFNQRGFKLKNIDNIYKELSNKKPIYTRDVKVLGMDTKSIKT